MEKPMKNSDLAVDTFMHGFTWSTSVFSAFSENLGLNAETAKKIACGPGGGVSHTGNICGAVTGAILAIGLKYGKSQEGDDASMEKTRELTNQLMNEFRRRHGSINCPELLGCDMSDPAQLAQAKKDELTRKRCPIFVRDASEILETILQRNC